MRSQRFPAAVSAARDVQRAWKVLGVVLGTRLPDSLKKALNNTLGIAAIAMGIVLILKVKNLSAVVLTLVIGSILGELVMLDDRIRKLVTGVVHKLMNGAAAEATSSRGPVQSAPMLLQARIAMGAKIAITVRFCMIWVRKKGIR